MIRAIFSRPAMTWREKLWQIHWLFVVLISAIAGIGFAMLYSAANGSLEPWASRQMARFAVGLVVMVGVATVDIRLWYRYGYVLYAAAFALLLAVETVGAVGMGAQRWIDLGVVNLQPSEVMKVALVVALARYFHGAGAEEMDRPLYLLAPAILVVAPVALVLRQPDLGTAAMLTAAGAAMFFLVGLRLSVFALAGVAAVSAVPFAWRFLRDYQKQRVLTFFNPESDPLGAGYHIIQSKIALGSGGLFGRGFLQGTQSHLNFLPEKQTDFVFTMLAEEFGLLGALVLLALYVLVLTYGVAIALRSRNHFGKLLALGITVNLFLYVFINMAMVMGLIPVVGVPLPLVSYGGTAMLSVLFGFGLLLGVYVHRDVPMGRRGLGAEP